MSSLIVAPKIESVFDGTRGDIYDRAQQENQGKGDKKPLHIVNKTPIDFEETTSITLSTTTELAMRINEVLKPLFSDYYGSDITVGGDGKLMVNLVFKAVTGVNDEKRAFLPIDKTLEKSQNKTMNRINQINAMNSSRNRRLELTGYGAEMIYDLLGNHVRKNMDPFKPQTMKQITGETLEQAGFTGIQNIYCTVGGIDINKILGLLYGVKDTDNNYGNENDNRIVYSIEVKRPLMSQQIPGAHANFIVEIQRMTVRKFNEAMAKIGMIPMAGSITAVTETLSEAAYRN